MNYSITIRPRGIGIHVRTLHACITSFLKICAEGIFLAGDDFGLCVFFFSSFRFVSFPFLPFFFFFLLFSGMRTLSIFVVCFVSAYVFVFVCFRFVLFCFVFFSFAFVVCCFSPR